MATNNPEDTKERITLDTTPRLYWEVPGGARGTRYEFLIEIAEDSDFSKNVRRYSSQEDKEPFSFNSPREAGSKEQVYIQVPYPLVE